ncbi:MAG: hypothetical protein HYU66_05515 [Armatimonadetes bacterium]|nr:hypothetical protein [Armatimonadota bacterium]
MVHELDAGGEDTYELDHFRPKSRHEFEHLTNCFYNLYWSCACNKVKNKGAKWPSDAELAAGICFVDLCADEVEKHYELGDDGVLDALTPSARYTVRALRLNDRQNLVHIRRILRRQYGADWHRHWCDGAQVGALDPEIPGTAGRAVGPA